MTCKDFQTLTPLYLSGELDKSLADLYDSHMKTCAACAEEFSAQRGIDAALLRSILMQRAESAEVEEYVRQKIAAEAPAETLHVRFLPARRRWIAAIGSVAAVALVGFFGYREFLSKNIPSVYAAVAQDHHREVVEQRPRSWVNSIAEIGSLAEQQGFSATLPESLVPAGNRLERAKLCRLDGHVYLHLVYSDGAQEFSVFLLPRGGVKPAGSSAQPANDSMAEAAPVHSAELGSEHLASVQSDRIIATVVTDRSSQSAIGLAEFVAKSI
jgi:anti-sigma factor RsiW